MSLEIIDNTFYLVRIPGEQTIHQNEAGAIDHLQERANDIDPDSEEVGIFRVSVEDDDWTIAEMPWQSIAIQLMGDN